MARVTTSTTARARRSVQAKTATSTTARAMAAERALLLDSHDVDHGDLDDALREDDGFSDIELPELVTPDEDDAPAADRPPALAPLIPTPKIRWWIDGTAGIRWAVRTPAATSAITAENLDLHAARLTEMASLVADHYPGVVTATTMYQALRAFEGTSGSDIDQHLNDGHDATFSRLRLTVVAFPWGMATLGTLTMLGPRGVRNRSVDAVVAFARYLGDPARPDRLSEPARNSAEARELKRDRDQIAAAHGVQTDTLSRVQPIVRSVLNQPSLVWSLRTMTPLLDWAAVARRLEPERRNPPHYVAVLAVAGAFDEQLAHTWARQGERA